MGGKLDWRRARRNLSTEDVHGENVELWNGKVTPVLHRDELATKSNVALKRWTRGLSAADKRLLGIQEKYK